MDQPKYVAMIEWVSAEKSGRKSLPIGMYTAVALFDGHDEYWSLVLKLYKQAEIEQEQEIQRADVWFLVLNAPHEWLQPKARFTLYEGARTVAHGQCMHKFVIIE